VRLATQLGMGLVGVIYVLDEPSIGLHPHDNQKLLDTLIALRDRGNTGWWSSIDEDTLRIADELIELGRGGDRGRVSPVSRTAIRDRETAGQGLPHRRVPRADAGGRARCETEGAGRRLADGARSAGEQPARDRRKIPVGLLTVSRA